MVTFFNQKINFYSTLNRYDSITKLLINIRGIRLDKNLATLELNLGFRRCYFLKTVSKINLN
jgi:hypothetical protein